jgi:hypothetical protein
MPSDPKFSEMKLVRVCDPDSLSHGSVGHVLYVEWDRERGFYVYEVNVEDPEGGFFELYFAEGQLSPE